MAGKYDNRKRSKKKKGEGGGATPSDVERLRRERETGVKEKSR